MNDTYELLAIKYGHSTRRSSENFIGGDPNDHSMPLDYFVWVIRNDVRTIVVDTGFGEKGARKWKREIFRPVDVGLHEAGVDPDAVKDVIITHLHYDHTGNLNLFPNAKFHIQDKEMAFATGRTMRHTHVNHSFELDDVLDLVRQVYAGSVVFHKGDEEIFPGISVHYIGGHSRGLQCVRVKTERGLVVLASDASHHYAHILKGKVFPACDSLSDALEGYHKLLKLGGGSIENIIPGHDPKVIANYPTFSNQTKGWIVRLDKIKE